MQNLPWYIARSTGLVAWVILAASMVWGLSISSRAAFGRRRDGTLRRPRPAWQLDLHRYLGGLATVLVLLHILAALADSYLHFTIAGVLVPFASAWRPAAVAWGVVGLYLMVAVEVSSLAKKRMPKSAWKAIHFASYPLFLVATIHGVTSGTDARGWIVRLFVSATFAVISGLTALRAQPPARKVLPGGPRSAEVDADAATTIADLRRPASLDA
ncbi:MAG TPA: ferric reductase-like transmembrane domain-containing protein [Acidimicrobiales bacterium]|nr:ferric reductase-like transmembrane domain-containing protein [Acidimicrobiales bacterium]